MLRSPPALRPVATTSSSTCASASRISGPSHAKVPGGPAVVDLGPAGAQHHVFHPVGGRPAGRRPRRHRETPRSDAPAGAVDVLFGDPVGERDHFVERRRHLPAVPFEHVGPIPHQGFRRDAVRRRVSGRRLGQVRSTLAVVLVDRGLRVVAQLDDQVACGEFGNEAGLRDDGDVGSVEAALHALAQIADEVGAAGVVHLDARRLLEVPQHCGEAVGFGAAVGPEDVDRFRFGRGIAR